MPNNDAPRKTITDAGAARRGRAKKVAAGRLKGKPLAGEARSPRAKAALATARRLGADAGQEPRKGRDLPLQRAAAEEAGVAGRSLWLQLAVEGKSIRVIDAEPVDVPGDRPPELRGTAFIEVRSGDELLAVLPLVDPGVAVGIPDYGSKEPFRGHRFIEQKAYETFIRVDLDRLEALLERSEQRTVPGLEINIVEAATHIAMPIEGSTRPLSAARGIGTRIASSGVIALDDVMAAGSGSKRRDASR